ncbi:MAG: exosortase A [Pseudomonadota bacterium]
MNNFILAYFITALSAVIIFYQTYHNMFDIWINSPTYQYGLLVFPISIYLIWHGKDVIKNINLYPSYYYLLLLFAVFSLWYFADLYEINFLKHFSALAYVPAIMLFLYGSKLLRTFIFPISFIIFGTPFGEEIVFILQAITHSGVMIILKILNFNPEAENLFILAGGQLFEVTRDCSGVRYFMATLIFSSLYAYIKGFSQKSTIIFILIAIFFPILLNILRASFIAVIAILGSRELAIGMDHTIYGMIFFIINVIIIIMIGVPLTQYFAKKLILPRVDNYR